MSKINLKRIISIISLSVLLACSQALAGSAKEQDIVVAKALYEAFGKGDMASAEKLADPNIEWIFHGQKHIIPYAGTFIGWQGVMDFFNKVGQTITMEKFAPESFSVAGDVVAVVGSETAVNKQTGGRYTSKWVHLITVKNGLITKLEEVTDSGAQIEAFTPADATTGKAYYTTCIGCHGIEGTGNFGMRAPNLTLLDNDYLIRQLRNFRHDVRGGTTDFYGWMMNGRSKALPGDRAVRDVVAYIDTLPNVVDVHSKPTDGNKKAGKAIYKQACVACHGNNGEGVPSLNAPELAGLQSWYVAEQLKKFRSGIRGKHKDDVYGAQMTPSAVALEDEQAVQNVVKYITTLKGSSK